MGENAKLETLYELVKKGDRSASLKETPLKGFGGYYEGCLNGSIDAAKALHDILLPDWIVHDFSQNSQDMGWTMVLASKTGMFSTSHEGSEIFLCSCPARAWLLAILRGLPKKGK